MKIAALVPRSRLYAAADVTYLAGLRGALVESRLAHELIVEPAGACAVKDQVLDKVQRLLLTHSPDVVTGIMGAGMVRHVDLLFRDAATPFIANDIGADPFMTSGGVHPYLFSNALNLWQSMYVLGMWSAGHVGRRAAVCTAFHEAGYGMISAFWRGFERGGGTIVGTKVTHRVTPDDECREEVQVLAALEPDVVFAAYSGREGVGFARACAECGLAGRVPIVATPFLAHAQWAERMPDLPEGIRTVLSWNLQARPDAHARFAASANVAAGQQPAVFALLGYETGLLIASAARAGAATLRDGLAAAVVGSPRGDIRFDAATQETASVDYLQDVGAGSLTSVQRLNLPDDFAEIYAAEQRREDRAGWINPYLVT